MIDWSTLIIGGAFLFLFALFLWPEHGLYFRVTRRRRFDSREAIEDALRHVHQREVEHRPADAESLAAALGFTTKATLWLVEKMGAQGLLRAGGGGFTLTAKGQLLALQVVRAHRLFERFLADETAVTLKELHERAGRVDHTLTLEQVDKLDADLGHPRFDPHGDPIPTASGELPAVEGRSLVEWPPDRPAEIVHIEDEPPEVFAQVVAEGLQPGMVITVVESAPERIVLVSEENEHVLAPVVASNITVRDARRRPAVPPSRRLTSLKAGEGVRVLGIDEACRGLTRRRFLDMGITSGAHIEPVMENPFGEPTAYRVRGTLIALRREQSDMILVEAKGGSR